MAPRQMRRLQLRKRMQSRRPCHAACVAMHESSVTGFLRSKAAEVLIGKVQHSTSVVIVLTTRLIDRTACNDVKSVSLFSRHCAAVCAA
eukprot:6488572-Amphidinium_carterae.1